MGGNSGSLGELGLWGVLGGGGIVFLGFVGFDGVSRGGEERKNGKGDMGVGIVGWVVIWRIVYMVFG